MAERSEIEGRSTSSSGQVNGNVLWGVVSGTDIQGELWGCLKSGILRFRKICYKCLGTLGFIVALGNDVMW